MSERFGRSSSRNDLKSPAQEKRLRTRAAFFVALCAVGSRSKGQSPALPKYRPCVRIRRTAALSRSAPCRHRPATGSRQGQAASSFGMPDRTRKAESGPRAVRPGAPGEASSDRDNASFRPRMPLSRNRKNVLYRIQRQKTWLRSSPPAIPIEGVGSSGSRQPPLNPLAPTQGGSFLPLSGFQIGAHFPFPAVSRPR